MCGTLKIYSKTDYLEVQEPICGKTGEVFCGRCGKNLQICAENGYTERSQFVNSLNGMNWHYTKKYGWVCPLCAKKVIASQRSRKNRKRRNSA